MTVERPACDVGLCRDSHHRYYWQGEGPLVSVTTVTGIIDKSGPLIWWATGLAAEAAIDLADTIPQMVTTSGRAATVDLLRKAADHRKRVAGDMGTRIHSIAESILGGADFTTSEEERPYADAVARFIGDSRLEAITVEEMVANLHYGYAGTFDLIAKIDGETWLLDWKTSKNVYREMALQLAAYGHAEFIGRPNVAKKLRIPTIDRYGIVHVRPEQYPGKGYDLKEMAVGDKEWTAFRMALGLHRWVNTKEAAA